MGFEIAVALATSHFLFVCDLCIVLLNIFLGSSSSCAAILKVRYDVVCSLPRITKKTSSFSVMHSAY